MDTNKKKIILIILLLILLSGSFIFLRRENKKEISKSENIILSENIPEIEVNTEENLRDGNSLKEEVDENKDTVPNKFLIDVPFTPQAPFAKWDELHEEACEEASIVMVKYFLDNKNLSNQIAEKEIQDLVKFQIEKYGDYRDSNAEQTMEMFIDFYGQPKNGLKMEVIYDFSKNDLKKYLAKGYPIIIPVAGRLLGNPNFTPPGPLYHVLVLVGYENNDIITNDPGTRKGQGYRYNIDVLYEAIHDFTGKKEDIEKGGKAMIVLE